MIDLQPSPSRRAILRILSAGRVLRADATRIAFESTREYGDAYKTSAPCKIRTSHHVHCDDIITLNETVVAWHREGLGARVASHNNVPARGGISRSFRLVENVRY